MDSPTPKPWYRQFYPWMLIALPACAVIGGFIVGILENLLGAYVIGTELKLTVALILIVGTLTLKPDGLFGKAVVTRV